MNLLRAELTRFTSRRLLRVMVLFLLVAFGFTIFTVMATSEQPTPQMWAQAQHQAEESKRYLTVEYQNCLKALTDRDRCADLNPDRVEVEQYLYGVFQFERQIKPLLYFLAAFLGLFGFLVTASFVGAEMNSGAMTNLLLWRPNRLAVLGSKLAIALLGVGVISALFTAIYVATFWGIAANTGYAGGLDEDSWNDIVLICLRAIGIGLVMSAIAFAVSTVGRRTAAALGALLGYAIVWEGGARLVAEMVRQDGSGGAPDPWFLSTYVFAWMRGYYNYYNYDNYDNMYNWDPVASTVHWWQAGVVLTVVSLAVLTVAFVDFRRRDLA